jgi:hypothetical protein
MEHLEVMTDRWLGQVECTCEIADARLPTFVRGDQGHQPQPHWVGQRLQ